MSRDPRYEQLLQDLLALHDRKNADYASPEDPTSNFTYAANVASGFTHDEDRVFATLLGVKLARIQELTKPGRTPRNESLADSFRDLANYAAIWAAKRIGEVGGRPTDAPSSPEPAVGAGAVSNTWTQVGAWAEDRAFNPGKFPK
jgi:hypothetical protein